MTGPPRIAVLISGGGRTLEYLTEAVERGALDARIAVVVASRECPGATRARGLGHRVEVIPGEIPMERLDHLLREQEIEWVVLGGYRSRLQIPERFRDRVVNIHPALLPRFGGKGMYGPRVHRAVIDAGETRSGCTVHLCDEEYDRGPILGQSECEVRPDDTPETLAARVFELERELYPRVLGTLFRESREPRSPTVRMSNG